MREGLEHPLKEKEAGGFSLTSSNLEATLGIDVIVLPPG